MTLQEMSEKCKLGKIGMFPGYDGYFKWDYYNLKLYYENYNKEKFPADNLKDWNKIKNYRDFIYII